MSGNYKGGGFPLSWLGRILAATGKYRLNQDRGQGQGPLEKRAGQSWGKRDVMSPRTYQDFTAHNRRDFADVMKAADRDVRR